MSISNLYRAIGPITSVPGSHADVSSARVPVKRDSGPTEFQQILNNQLNFSKHAETRIRSREIAWDDALASRVSKGIDSAQLKGSREALILAGDVAVIANVKSRTIITAMDRNQMKEQVFTNIDSAVLV